jgi:hypothetical protein
MSRRAVTSVLGATVLLAASVAGASSAHALASGATAPNLDFGNVAVYATVQQDVVVTATGEAVTFGAPPVLAAVGGATDQLDDFSIVSNTCLNTIATGESCAVKIAFNPFAAGLRQATLDIETTTPAATVPVGLRGTGVPNATGTYYGLTTPTRFLDTRSNNGLPLKAGSTTSVQITTRAGIPATGVSAVVFNLTAVGTTASGFFTTYPSGKPRPTTSSINFPRGWTGANMVTLPVGADGKINLFNSGGTAHALVDVLGWYAKDDSVRVAPRGMGSQFRSTAEGDAVRLYDSRKDPANGNLPFASGDFLDLTDTWGSVAEATAVKAYAITVTATAATGSGVFTAWAGGAVPKPLASAVNYQKGITAPNMVIVPAGHFDAANPDLLAANQTGFRVIDAGSGTVHMLVDLVGYYVADDAAGMRFTPLASADAPVRILDTRKGTGLSGPFGPGQARTVDATSVTSTDSAYLVGNTTGVTPTVATFLTLWSGDNPLPGVSNLNLSPNAIRAVSTYAPLSFTSVGPKLTFNIFNKAGTTNVLFDAAGTLDLYPGQATVPAGTTSSGPGSPTATLSGRTVPGGRSIPSGHDAPTARRG